MALTIPLATQMRDAFTRETLTPPDGADLGTYQREVCARYAQADRVHHAVIASYGAFMEQLAVQWLAMKKAGVNVEFCDSDPTPLVNGKISYKAFVDDVLKTGILRVYRSDGSHPILDLCGMGHGNRWETLNSIFRAVHDWYGHLASGGHFGWRGETMAYYSHASTFDVAARQALFSETVAQQCWYAVRGDYAPQKCVLYGPGWHLPPLA